MEIGKYNHFKIKTIRDNELVVTTPEGDHLTVKGSTYSVEGKSGDDIELFVYTDNKGNPNVTLEHPIATVGQCGVMRVKEITPAGAFLTWGIEKDLFVPFGEQKDKMREGYHYVVAVYVDEETNRVAGSTRLGQFIQNEIIDVKEGDKVELLICDETDLGTNVIVNNHYWGLLYKNEIFKRLKKGQRVPGYIKKIREENKLDVSLQAQGYDEVKSSSQHILERIERAGGFIALNDKSDPQTIYDILQMSKKVFKKAIGALYKEKKITIEEDGIRIVK